MCRQSNENKNLSNSSTSAYIIDLSESIIMQEWFSGIKNYISHRCSKYRWLVAYKGEEGEEIFDSWVGWLDDNKDQPITNNSDTAQKFLRKFGLIP